MKKKMPSPEPKISQTNGGKGNGGTTSNGGISTG
jgi:hypothetical protein